MFYRIFFFCYFLFCSLIVKAQLYNLVPNSSFEDYSNCPNPPTNGLSGLASWFNPTISQSIHMNYFNECFSNACCGVPYNLPGFQYPQKGNAYIGGYMMYVYGSDIRNYAQTQLIQSLSNNKYYYVELFVNLANKANYGVNNIGLLLTDTATKQSNNGKFIAANPQIINYGNPIIKDTLNWVKVSAIYKAQGGEQFITIGNFKSDIQTDTIGFPAGFKYGGYYIDDVSVIPLDSFNLKADAGRDTTITLGDSVFIGSYTNGIDSLKWQILNTNNTIDSIRPGFWVHPTSYTCYVLTQTVNGYTSSDTVCISVGTVPLKFIRYNLVSSLRGTKQSIENTWQTANEINVSHFNIQRSLNGKDFTTIGKVAAQNKITNEYTFYNSPPVEGLGVVYYRIESVDFDGRKQYTETRMLNFKPQTLNGISIYPNPAKEFVTIESKDIIKQIKVINQVGQIVYSNTINRTSYILNLTLFSKGLFIVQSTTNKGEINTQKLVVE